MRELSFVLFFMFTGLNAFSQFATKQENFFIDTINQSRYFGSESDSTITFTLDTITEQQFKNVKQLTYKSSLDTSTKGITRNDTILVVPIQYGFKAFPSNGLRWYTYRGIIHPLNLYVIDFVSGPGGTHDLKLVDKRTGAEFVFSSLFDNGLNPPLLSPKQNFLLAMTNNVFDHNESMISVVKINYKGNAYTLTNFYQRVSNEGHIAEIKWIDETSFVYKVQFTGESDYETSFFKVSWKK